jgi:hypothetical protein
MFADAKLEKKKKGKRGGKEGEEKKRKERLNTKFVFYLPLKPRCAAPDAAKIQRAAKSSSAGTHGTGCSGLVGFLQAVPCVQAGATVHILPAAVPGTGTAPPVPAASGCYCDNNPTSGVTRRNNQP